MSPDGEYQNQTDYILCSQRRRSSIQSGKTRPGADCGSDCEILIANLRLKFKKVRKSTRSFRYDLNIPYDYTEEVINIFKGLNLIECLKNYGWRFITLYRRRWSKPSPRKGNTKSKNVIWGGLTTGWEKTKDKKLAAKGKGEKERYIHLMQSSKE